MTHVGYPDIDRYDQLPEQGREMLGQDIYWTVKRDGQNVQCYMHEGEVCVGSRHFTWEGGFSQPIGEAIKALEEQGDTKGANRLEALRTIINDVKDTPQYAIIRKMLADNPTWHIYCEHLMPGSGPTRIERARKHSKLLLLDIMDNESFQFMHYNLLHQTAYQYRMPIPPLFLITQYRHMEEMILSMDQLILPYCRRNHYEGMVARAYWPRRLYFKVKVDLPRPTKREPPVTEEVRYPPLPEEKLDRAIDNARAKCLEAGGNPLAPKDMMPLVALHINQECKEHLYSPPRNYFVAWESWKRRMSEKAGGV